MTPEFTKIEIYLCYLIYFIFFAYLLYLNYTESRKYLNLHKHHNFVDKNGYDVTDYEWFNWKEQISFILVGYLCHFLISQFVLIRFFPGKTEIKNYFNLLFGLLLVFYRIGTIYLCSLLLICLFFRSLINLVTEHFNYSNYGKLIFWSLFLASIKIFSYDFFSQNIYQAADDQVSAMQSQTFLFIFSQSSIRIGSFCLEYLDFLRGCKNQDSKVESEKFSVKYYLVYIFYWPPLMIGPWTNYDKFYGDWTSNFTKSEEKEEGRFNHKQKLINFLKHISRWTLILILTHFWTKLFHHNALSLNEWALNSMSFYTLISNYILMDVFFYLKYRIFYGLGATYCKYAENLSETTERPNCVMHNPTLNHLWKNFDKGLHEWLVKYIFKPLLRITKSKSPVNHIIASFCTFMFTAFWHGGVLSLANTKSMYFVWAITQWLGLVSENIGEAYFQKLRNKNLRFKALGLAMIYHFILISNNFFLSGNQITMIYIKRFYLENWRLCLLAHLFSYCGSVVTLTSKRCSYFSDREKMKDD